MNTPEMPNTAGAGGTGRVGSVGAARAMTSSMERFPRVLPLRRPAVIGFPPIGSPVDGSTNGKSLAFRFWLAFDAVPPLVNNLGVLPTFDGPSNQLNPSSVAPEVEIEIILKSIWMIFGTDSREEATRASTISNWLGRLRTVRTLVRGLKLADDPVSKLTPDCSKNSCAERRETGVAPPPAGEGSAKGSSATPAPAPSPLPLLRKSGGTV